MYYQVNSETRPQPFMTQYFRFYEHNCGSEQNIREILFGFNFYPWSLPDTQDLLTQTVDQW